VAWAQTGSDKSLKAGLGSGGALLLAAVLTKVSDRTAGVGATMGLVLSLALAGVFTLRWTKVEEKVPPLDPVGVMTHPSGLLGLSLLSAVIIGAAKGGI